MSRCNCTWHLAANRFCPAQNLDMREGTHRLKTFTIFGWPLMKTTSILDLAEAGFHNYGKADTVRCFLCRVRLTGWKEGDCPSEAHKKFSPDCPFVLGQRTYNIPIISCPYPAQPPPIHDYDYPCC